MAQFDVHRNLGQMRTTIPYVVIVQSSLFDSYRRRVVVPLVLQDSLGKPLTGSRLNPVFTIEGKNVVLHPLDLTSVPFQQLGECISSLSDFGQNISDVLDELLSRSWA